MLSGLEMQKLFDVIMVLISSRHLFHIGYILCFWQAANFLDIKALLDTACKEVAIRCQGELLIRLRYFHLGLTMAVTQEKASTAFWVSSTLRGR